MAALRIHHNIVEVYIVHQEVQPADLLYLIAQVSQHHAGHLRLEQIEADHIIESKPSEKRHANAPATGGRLHLKRVLRLELALL